VRGRQTCAPPQDPGGSWFTHAPARAANGRRHKASPQSSRTGGGARAWVQEWGSLATVYVWSASRGRRGLTSYVSNSFTKEGGRLTGAGTERKGGVEYRPFLAVAVA